MHLYQTDGSDGLIKTVRIFLGIGILILSIASINYVNLSTARAMIRAKEVSVRKMIGAGKFQLFVQFIFESILVFLLATVAAMLLTALSMPVNNHISGQNLSFSLFNPNIWMVILIVVASHWHYPAFTRLCCYPHLSR